MDAIAVGTGALFLELDAQRTSVRRQGREGVTPALGFGQTLAQFAFVTDGNTRAFKRIEKLVKRFVAQTAVDFTPFFSVR